MRDPHDFAKSKIRRRSDVNPIRKLPRILYTVMRYGVAYQKRSEEEFTSEHRERQEKNLHRRAKELGYELKKIEIPAAELS